jgi:hypothetical protein
LSNPVPASPGAVSRVVIVVLAIVVCALGAWQYDTLNEKQMHERREATLRRDLFAAREQLRASSASSSEASADLAACNSKGAALGERGAALETQLHSAQRKLAAARDQCPSASAPPTRLEPSREGTILLLRLH